MIGREFDLELLSAIVDAEEATLLDHLERAVAAVRAGRVLRAGRAVSLRPRADQPDALRGPRGHAPRPTPPARRRRRSRISTAADPGEHLAELALHWRLAAVSIDKPKAADYALKAGSGRYENLAPDEASSCSRAAELVDADSLERCER